VRLDHLLSKEEMPYCLVLSVLKTLIEVGI